MQKYLAVRTEKVNSAYLKLGLFGGGITLGLTGLYVVDPASLGFSVCPFHSITGWHCPACGATRAAHQLLHGQLLNALHLNLLLVLTLPVLGWVGWNYSRATLRGQIWPGLKLSSTYVIAIFGLMSVFTVLRNLPFAPFNWLAP